MLRILVKKQLAEIFRSYFYDPKSGKARSHGATVGFLIGFALLMVGLLGGMFTMFAVLLCPSFVAADMGWMYFTLFSLIALALGVFGSVFNTYAGLYLAKDNDLLLSMPIPVRYIMISRLLGVYLTGLMYAGVVILPAIVVYLIMARVTVSAVVGCLLLLLLLSVIVLFFSCLLGFAVARISLKLKRRGIVTVLISLVFLGAYYLFYFRAQEIITSLLADLGAWGARLQSAYPLYLLGRVGEGDLFAMLTVTAAVALLSALLWFVMSHSFLRIATAQGGTARRTYREKRASVRSASRAMLGKELARFVGSPSYMLNCGLGLVFLLAVAVLILVKGGELTAQLGAEELAAFLPFVPLFFVGIMGALTGMVDVTSPSVSLEGQSVWIAHSLPISPWVCLRAKLMLHIVLTAPLVLVCSVIGIAVFRPSLPGGVLMLLIPQVTVLFQAELGLAINLLHPVLNWSNEIYPIKQSLSVFLSLLAGLLIGAAPIPVGLLLGAFLGATVLLLIWGILLLGASVGILLWLRGPGAKRFARV